MSSGHRHFLTDTQTRHFIRSLVATHKKPIFDSIQNNHFVATQSRFSPQRSLCGHVAHQSLQHIILCNQTQFHHGLQLDDLFLTVRIIHQPLRHHGFLNRSLWLNRCYGSSGEASRFTNPRVIATAPKLVAFVSSDHHVVSRRISRNPTQRAGRHGLSQGFHSVQNILSPVHRAMHSLTARNLLVANPILHSDSILSHLTAFAVGSADHGRVNPDTATVRTNRFRLINGFFHGPSLASHAFWSSLPNRQFVETNGFHKRIHFRFIYLNITAHALSGLLLLLKDSHGVSANSAEPLALRENLSLCLNSVETFTQSGECVFHTLSNSMLNCYCKAFVHSA